MLKEIADFISTGLSMIALYAVYFFAALFSTILLGIPIGFGVYYVIKFINYFFNGV